MTLTTRRQREGLLWRTDRPPRKPLWQTVKDAMLIIATLLGILAAHSWTVEQDLKDQLAMEQHKTKLANARTVALMNGRGLHDRETNTLYLTEKVVSVPLGDKK